MKPTNATMQKVLQIIADKLGVNQNILTNNTSFSDDLGADSLDVYELIMSIEKEFKITITDDHAEKLITVGAVINYLESKNNITKNNMQVQQSEALATNRNSIEVSANYVTSN
jgi:acyl carrier protein